jgi:2-polyprenyl-3-methyl-5-hydroxy-6-metoxy-1,4-benzoquinol methylase
MFTAMENFDQYFEANKSMWNLRTVAHRDSAFYDRAGFKAGKNVLTPIELKEVGDVKGKSMLHLQCHFGMDSLNWARKGARVTGVDLSNEAIKEAKELNSEMGLDAQFLCANVYDLHPGQLANTNVGDHQLSPGSFDIVFTTYGVIGWLPDLKKWAEIIQYYLKPGGFLYLAEFHPVVWIFDDEFTHVKYHYDNRELIETENLPTYTDKSTAIPGKEYSWNHSLSEVMNALIGQGLRIDEFNEFMYSPYPCFNRMVEVGEGQWGIKGMEGKLPMVYSIKAYKQ